MIHIKGRIAGKLFEGFPYLKKNTGAGTFLGEKLFLCIGRRNDSRDDQNYLEYYFEKIHNQTLK